MSVANKDLPRNGQGRLIVQRLLSVNRPAPAERRGDGSACSGLGPSRAHHDKFLEGGVQSLAPLRTLTTTCDRVLLLCHTMVGRCGVNDLATLSGEIPALGRLGRDDYECWQVHTLP